MEKPRRPYGVRRSGRSARGGAPTCGPAQKRMTAAAPRVPCGSRCPGWVERRPGPHGGKADVVGEVPGRGTSRAAGGGVQARRAGGAATTSGRSASQQGLTAPCTDRVWRGDPRHAEGGGLAPEPVGAMQAGEPRRTWSSASTMSEVTPRAGPGALGPWQLQEEPDMSGR